MIGHSPTIFASIALVALIMAFCLFLVTRFQPKDGMLTTGYGLICHALAYCGYASYGFVPLWLSYSLANTLLSLAVAFYTVSIARIQGRQMAWWPVFSLPLLMAVLQAVLLPTQEPRMLAASVVLLMACVLLLYHARQHVLPGGKAHLLLVIGATISIVSLLLRVAAVLAGQASEMHYNASNLKQTISISIGTLTVMMFSLGLVLLSKERSESALQEAALKDALTGLANRRAIFELLEQALSQARRSATPLAIAMVDVDHFKSINDRYGHLVGDEVLRRCTQHMQQRLRRSDSVGRYGGEEFLLILPGTEVAGAVAVLNMLRESVAHAPMHIDHQEIRVHFSTGVWCGVPGPGDTADQLIQQADAALYAAKTSGRNTVCLAPGCATA